MTNNPKNTETFPTVAVLIDADNTPYNSIKEILDASAGFGRTTIKRAYGDWTQSNLQVWQKVFKEYAIKPIQQFRFTTGKNVTDSAMIVEAMDILHSKLVDVFILVTSDSDFTGLATRIREEGLQVIGIGRKTAPRPFVKGCDQFLLIENLQNADMVNSGKKISEKQNVETEETGRDLLIRAVRLVVDENGLVKGAKLAATLRRLDPSFNPLNYGVRKLADFVELYPDVLKLTGKRTATDPTYRVELE